MKDEITAQARETASFLRKSHWDWRLEGGVLGVLDVAVTLGFAFKGDASKLCFRDNFQLKWRFWWMRACSERVEVTPNVWCGANFAEANMK